MSKIGFIGTGIMGFPMAKHLQDAGHELVLSEHYKPAPEALVNDATILCQTPAEVAEVAEFVITILPDTPDVESVMFGDQGVASGITEGTLVIDMSSISPTATKTFAEKIKAQGGDYLDAPVSGGQVGAESASLTIMVGGSAEAFAKAQPLFDIMGKNITHVGGNGDGQTCKVANQIIVALNLEAVSEALVFAKKAGADPAKVREALMGGFAASRILELHGQKMIDRNFQPGFKVKLHQKDLNLALASAKELGVSLPHTSSAQQLFNHCVAQGGSEWDHSSIVTVLETLANEKIS